MASKSVGQVPVESWDTSQDNVIRSASSARLIVGAGPGTGKTAVSCARLAFLIEDQGVQPSHCWMISFTRTAVAEIRARLYSYLGEDAFAVKVATIDSQAWAIHSGFDPAASLTGTYEQNIEHVTEMIRNDPDVQEYIEGIEHLVVDEAQDFVGNRAALVDAMIRALDSNAGVTIFADEAQAIYGFSERISLGSSGDPLLTRICHEKEHRFKNVALTTVHRTQSSGLLQIFTEVRRLLSKGEPAEGIFARIRAGVAKHADGNDLTHQALDLDSLPASSLVLFRNRAEALELSQFSPVPHSLRLQGYGANMPPWIAVCFHDSLQSHIGKQEFIQMWLERVENRCAPQYEVTDAWERLIRAGGAADGSLDLKRLRVRLGTFTPPIDLTNHEYGLPGPIIGTIHASKGREADNVFLFMPDPDEFEDNEAEQEEARVLFVGSTRARHSLRVGKGKKWTGGDIDTGRLYRQIWNKEKSVAMVEVGRPEDVSALTLVGKTAMPATSAVTAQAWFADHAGTLVNSLNVASDAGHDWNYKLFEPTHDVLLGWLSPRFRDDMWSIGKVLSANKKFGLRPPSRIAHIKAHGSRTVVLGPDDPVLEKLHQPWSRTGFLLAPRLASFTRATFPRTSK
jgi:hypothetical protein